MKKILISLAVLLAGGFAYAQNLNPVVEVTNNYAQEASGIEKPSQLLPLPDSVFKFNLDFDYSVHSTPYKGAYEFNPYLVQMRPSQRLSPEQKLYLRVGAGYRFHPELDVVWNPVRKQNFRVDVYAGHQSYMGRYRSIVEKDAYFVSDGNLPGGGVNARSTAGANLFYAWGSGTVTAYASYQNTLASDLYNNHVENSAYPTSIHHKGQFQARVKANPGAEFQYNLGTRVAYLGNGTNEEFHTVSDLLLGKQAGRGFLSVKTGVETVNIPGTWACKLDVAPHYRFSRRKLLIDLGFKYSYLFQSDTRLYAYQQGVSGDGSLFPDIAISYPLSEQAVLQASVTGGSQISSYDSLLEENPYLDSFNWYRNITVERVHVSGGVHGSVKGRFSYDARIGYKWLDNAYSWSYLLNYPNGTAYGPALSYPYWEAILYPQMCYVSPLHVFYGTLKLGWKSEAWDVAAKAYYGYTPMPTLETEIEKNVFAPAPFNAQGHVFYNWMGRIKGGVTVDACSKRAGKVAVPAYQDLGLYGEYSFGRGKSAWLKVGNLLNQAIQRIPFYAEGGLYATAGVTLVF